MKTLRAILFCAAALVLASCYPARLDPQLYTYDSARVVSESARLHALNVQGTVYLVMDTHSMEPLLFGGDLVVVAPVGFDALKLGQVITYRADWAAPDAPPVTHRIVARDSDGLLLSGDNVAHTENKHRVTARNYVGLVVGIYRLSK